MKSFVLLPAVLAAAVLLIAATASAAGAAPKGEFKAQFHDDDCVAHTLCGTGLVEGYGQVTTTLDLTGGDFDPSTGCLINATAIRDIELVGDPLSTLTLALTDGVLCGNKGSATFTISGGTGAFAGLVILPGTVRVTPIPGVPADTAQIPGNNRTLRGSLGRDSSLLVRPQPMAYYRRVLLHRPNNPLAPHSGVP